MSHATGTTLLQRLLRMVKYVAQYIPHESDIGAPLRELLKQTAEWKWQPHHDKAIENIMTALTRAPDFYDSTISISQYSLSVMLRRSDCELASYKKASQ